MEVPVGRGVLGEVTGKCVAPSALTQLFWLTRIKSGNQSSGNFVRFTVTIVHNCSMRAGFPGSPTFPPTIMFWYDAERC